MTEPREHRRAIVVVPAPSEPLVARGARAALGLLGRVGHTVDRATGGSGQVPPAVDAALGAAAATVDAGTVVVRVVDVVAGPVVRVVARPPLVPRRLTAGWWWDRLADRGRDERYRAAESLDGVAQSIVPAVADGVLERLDLTRVVLQNVDLGTVVEAALDEVDLTQVVESRVDLERVVTAALDRLDLTDVVVTRVELSRLVSAVLDTLDLTNLVLTRVDLAAVVAGALDRLDLTQLVLDRVELDRVVTQVLDGMDLTQLVLDRVELDRVVTQVLDGMDLTQLVAERVDIDALVGGVDLDAVVDRIDMISIANYIIDEIDLPEIIRESTSGVATGAVRGVRMTSIDADARVSGVVDRILLRRKARRIDAPGDPESLTIERELEVEVGDESGDGSRP